jgi:hypothetical protein
MVGLAPSATGRVDEFGAENPGMFLVSLTVRLTATDAPAEALDVNVADLRTRSDREMVTVNDHAHRKAIDLGNCPGDTCCPDRSRAAEQRTEHRAERGQPAATNDIASVY